MVRPRGERAPGQVLFTVAEPGKSSERHALRGLPDHLEARAVGAGRALRPEEAPASGVLWPRPSSPRVRLALLGRHCCPGS